MPHDTEVQDKKYKVDSKNQFDISSEGTNGILVVIKISSKGEDVGSLDNSEEVSDYHLIKLDVEIESFSIVEKKCRVIVLHSNDFDEENEESVELIECARDFVAKNGYDSEVKLDFKNCKVGMRPETSGGSILVGV